MWQKDFINLITKLSLLLCILLIISFLIWQNNPLAKGVRYLSSLTTQSLSTINATVKLTNKLLVRFDTYRELEDRYKAAQKQIETYELEKDKFELLRLENKQLRTLLHFPSIPNYAEIKAEVLSKRITNISPRLIINQGSSRGIKPFMPVFCRCFDQNKNIIRTVVGIISSTRKNISIVHPIIHPAFKMGARIGQTGEWALVNGNSGKTGTLLLNYVASHLKSKFLVLKAEDFNANNMNQYIYSSGDGGIFPKGIPIGYIIEIKEENIEGNTAYVKPFTNFFKLTHVIVIKKEIENWQKIQDSKEDFYNFLISEYKPATYPPGLSKKRKKLTSRKAGKKKTAKPVSQNNKSKLSIKDQKKETPKIRTIQNLRP